MAYAIDRQKALDLVGGSAECEYDDGAHSPSRTVYVARSVGGPARLGTWSLGNDGTFTSIGGETVVGHGSRTRVTVETTIASFDLGPVPLVTPSRVAAGALRLVSRRLRKALDYVPVGQMPIGTVNKP